MFHERKKIETKDHSLHLHMIGLGLQNMLDYFVPMNGSAMQRTPTSDTDVMVITVRTEHENTVHVRLGTGYAILVIPTMKSAK